MKNLFAIIMAAILCTTGCHNAFTRSQREVIFKDEGIMPVMSIEKPNEELLLRQISKPLSRREVASEEFATLCRRMLLTVRNPENEGVGIAAPQVGILRRVVAVQRFDKEGEPFEFYVNPKITKYGEQKEYGGEGCLSIPNRYEEVLRSQSIVVEYRDTLFKRHTETIEGFTAVIFQHEIDHLDGILYIDRVEEAPKHSNEAVAVETTAR